MSATTATTAGTAASAATTTPTRQKEEDHVPDHLRCSVCWDAPVGNVQQCLNGHLLCGEEGGCLAKLRARALAQNEEPLCPQCRVKLLRVLSRCLVAEQGIALLREPATCDDPFFDGYVVHYLVNNPVADAASTGEAAKSIVHHGGRVSPLFDARTVTHVVLETLGQPGTADEALYLLATRHNKRVVSWFWLEACIKRRDVVSIDDSPTHVPPLSLHGVLDMASVHVCVTGYTGARRADLITIVDFLGATYLRVLDRRSTHLVCYEFEGAKWAKAKKTKLQWIVSHKWLEECLRQWKRLPEGPFTTWCGNEEDRLAEIQAEARDS